MSEKLKNFILTNFPNEKGDPEDIAINLLAKYAGIKPPAQLFGFDAIIYFNIGLGQESKIVKVVAENPKLAKKIGEEKANTLLGNGKWQEVRVKPTGPVQA
jgi:hypothetical protein